MGGSDEIGSVVKAFTVLQAFSAELPRATISQIADATGLTRPTARRILLTCVGQGFVATDGKDYWLAPKVMRLGFGYLSSLPFWDVAQPHMRTLAQQVEETCSLATLDGTEVVYIARVPVRPSVIALNVGSRLPAHATSLGKALVAFAEPDVVESFLAQAPFASLTEQTVTDAEELREQLAIVRERGFAYNDGEREVGVRSVAAPILSRSGTAVAAVNVAANALRVSADAMLGEYAERLLATAHAISAEIAYTSH